MDFYPSISKELLTKSINYAKSITPIEEEVITTVFHARKSLLLDKTSVWVKKDNSDFDVTMGSYDGAEVCELVGLYLLNLLTNEFGKNNIGLYRDHGLSCFQNISGLDSEKIKNKMCKIFTENGLNITVECNLVITDFLDVTFDLKSGTYYPYRKKNNKILYIHKQSNHQPSIMKQIPPMISKQASDISCDSDHFNKAVPDYNTALKKSGFNENIKYSPNQPKQRNRKRQIIWFNPPYSVNVKTNVGKLFMKLIDKHFPCHHKFHKRFNRNNIKLSYTCIPSMKNVIQKHNSKIMEDPKPTNNKTCSCRQKSDCPLNQNCLSECLVYNAVVNRSTTKNYYGTCEKSFKERYNNHTSSFRNKSHQKSTELSNYIWELKENGENYTINWLIAMKAHPYNCGTRKCDLCFM